MYTPVLIDRDNQDCFLKELELEMADFWVGIVENKSETACGVLGAEFVPEEGGTALSVSYLLVPEGEHKTKAEEALLQFLLEAADALHCSVVYDAELIREEGDEKRESRLRLGFYQEKKSTPLYTFSVSDVDVKAPESTMKPLPLNEITDAQWEDFLTETSDYSFAVMERDAYDKELSLFLSDERQKLQGAILFRTRGDKLFVEAVAPYGADESILINDLVYWALQGIQKKERPEKQIQMYLPERSVYHSILMDITGSRAKKTASLVEFVYEVPV